MRAIRKLIIPISCGVIVVILMRLVFFIGYVPSASMEPSIKKGSYIFGMRFYEELKRGDIIVFRLDGQDHVKRIAAVPGDTVYIDDMTHEIGINQQIETATRSLIVPSGCFFVLGDNKDDSLDSRYWEDVFIKSSDIIAKSLVFHTVHNDF